MHTEAIFELLGMLLVPIGILYLVIKFGSRLQPSRRPDGWRPLRHDSSARVRPLRDFLEGYRSCIQNAVATGQHHTIGRWKDAMHAELERTPPDFGDVLPLLQDVRDNPDAPLATYVFQAATHELSPRYVPVLCEIVDSDRHAAWHEPAIELLGELGAPEAIPALRKALGSGRKTDGFGDVSEAALEALRAIGTREARAVLEEARHSPLAEVREAASEFFERR